MSDILFFEKSSDSIEPTRASTFSAGLDLASPKDYCLEPLETIKIDTGIKIKLPNNSYGRVCGRSSSFLEGLFVFDGVIDFDYSGTIKLLVRNNWSTLQNFISKGERIAQLIVQPFILPVVAEVNSINNLSSYIIKNSFECDRNERGLGSSGIF